MTKRVTITVPDDVAATLDEQPNASAYVTEAVRQRTGRHRHREAMRAVGIDPDALGGTALRQKVRDAMLRNETSDTDARRQLIEDLSAGNSVAL